MEGKLVGDCHCHHRLVPSGYCDIAGHITSCSHCQKPDQPIESKEYYVANCACCNKGLTKEDDKILSNYHFNKTDTLCSNCAKQDLAVAHQEAMNTSYYRKQELQEKIKQELIKKLEEMKTDIPDDGYKPAEITSLADMGAHRAYNQALSECIETIKEM